MMWWLARGAFRGVRNAGRNKSAPKPFVPYRGRYQKTYNTTRFITTIGPLIPLAILFIMLCMAK